MSLTWEVSCQLLPLGTGDSDGVWIWEWPPSLCWGTAPDSVPLAHVSRHSLIFRLLRGCHSEGTKCEYPAGIDTSGHSVFVRKYYCSVAMGSIETGSKSMTKLCWLRNSNRGAWRIHGRKIGNGASRSRVTQKLTSEMTSLWTQKLPAIVTTHHSRWYHFLTHAPSSLLKSWERVMAFHFNKLPTHQTLSSCLCCIKSISLNHLVKVMLCLTQASQAKWLYKSDVSDLQHDTHHVALRCRYHSAYRQAICRHTWLCGRSLHPGQRHTGQDRRNWLSLLDNSVIKSLKAQVKWYALANVGAQVCKKNSYNSMCVLPCTKKVVHCD